MAASQRASRGQYFHWKENANSVPEEVWAIPHPGDRLEALKSHFKRALGANEWSKIDAITQSSMEQAFKTYVDMKERDKIMAMRSGGKSKPVSERKRGTFFQTNRLFGFCGFLVPFFSRVGEAP